ncbi:hypothetical protein [Streptomyces sp. WMMB 322]|uniref:hypothetical protein n=1 Tax=Streptomyces sp. WMMB 322 TaxID=1286821 RepID=UPI0006E37337|nr:hypothetical protein [Streptomyces sp. WMMB 322]SCK41066.1 hypothetical protein H180DRAFT_03564 [Streptomyces sp. WMMB 322]
MTACAPEAVAADSRTARHSTFTIAADGAYAARLNASEEDGWFPERWTLDGPEPYAVPLPGARPEEPDSQVLPLTDGRVLIARREDGAHRLALLYPTGPGTGELDLGSVESEWFALLPPAPCGRRAYALTVGEHTTGVWLVAGGGDGVPQLIAEVPGRCGGGAWLDREGRLLAVDRTDTAGTGRTKTVAVDLGRGGEVSPLLQITDESDDRLLLADADSGLLIVRSDAPGEFRLGWGVLGSHRPVRFPESLHPTDALLTPFAVQPGQMLLPESCAVALHGQTTGTRAGGAWLGVWRPMQKELRRFRAPGGWLPGRGVWTREGELRLPCATAHAPCGLARLRMRGRSADADAGATVTGTGTGETLGGGVHMSAAPGAGTGAGAGPAGAQPGGPAAGPDTGSGAEAVSEAARGERAEAGREGPARSPWDGSRSVMTGGLPSAAPPAAGARPAGAGSPRAGSPGAAPQIEQRAPAKELPPPEPRNAAHLVPPGALPAEVPPRPETAPRLPPRLPPVREAATGGPAEGPRPAATAAEASPSPMGPVTSVDGTSASPAPAASPPGAAASPSLAVAATCAGRKPVPLQDAPLAAALHEAAVRARTV